ncbi:hypothetical protein SLEP1_g35604 [Rubroshorea leprosula]|uniref:Protein SMG7 n=1 Tax=Rubroshorea leprosula TaxID=152421 RepID=A0AAV5KNR7_9ROSI|nr:hypothetical protein SLEP1_g35604 [Rubroshorea leprosula]
MMIEPMDKKSAPSSRELVQCLYEKNIDLENKRRKSAKARVPSDPNAWQQMRENYEAIILEDHTFSEQHSIEYALWQLHYRRIEELRALFSAALASSGSNTSQGVKGPVRPDRISKIRLQFKTFLSEATGFYHELILKIRSKYGLPLGYFSEDSENPTITDKDGKKSDEIKKGLVSCHRCLIYLGDLARYKGLYGEGDSITREYAAASSYYLQAASIWPSSGNPHHQLAILASYSGDELVAVYRYFRSLAVENPFSTARDNLIVAFEKNRQNYSLLIGDGKTSLAKECNMRISGKGRAKAEMKAVSKDTTMGPSPVKEKVSSVEMYKVFCIRFVRLNGILFTRTSLETFADVLTLVNSDLCKLLSSGPEEELNFGTDATDNALLIVRLVSILIFTVHNLKRESEGQTYADIVQRTVLLQNAFTAVFELMNHIIERCLQLRDISSSYLLPGILVFLEWLACCPDIASAGGDVDEKQSTTLSNFWKQCILFLNKTLLVGPVCIDDNEDETCFFNMSRYEEGETENCMALWEDFELRGFLPLLPAHTILDFSVKHSFRSDGNKEQKARLKRILAAGKALANIARVDQKTVCFDSKAKKFVIGVEPLDDAAFTSTSSPPRANGLLQETPAEEIINIGVGQPNSLPMMDGEEIVDDDDEVIVFKPIVAEKRTDVVGPNWPPYDSLMADQSRSAGDEKFHGISVSASSSLNNLWPHTTIELSPPLPVSVGNIFPQHLLPIPSHATKWSAGEATLVNGLRGLNLLESKILTKPEMQEHIDISHLAARSVAIPQSIGVNTNGMFYTQANTPEMVIPSRIDGIAVSGSGVRGDTLAARTSSAFPVGPRKNPVSRPVRHLGPPPGFGSVPPKPQSEAVSASDLENPLMDDYSWLDGYKLPSAVKGPGLDVSVNYTSHANSQYVNNVSNGLSGTVSFPFPGKQVPTLQFQMENQKGWQDGQALENLKFQHEQKLQQLINGNQQFTSLPEEYQGQSVWMGRYFV